MDLAGSLLALCCAGRARAKSDLDLAGPGRASVARDLDAGRYGATWEEASPMLKDAMPKVQWETGLERTRGAMGVVVARKIRLANCTRGTRADPEAEICVIQYDTQFERRLGDEQVTVLRGSDGAWRVAAYSLR
jgi:hypothetical protein